MVYIHNIQSKIICYSEPNEIVKFIVTLQILISLRLDFRRLTIQSRKFVRKTNLNEINRILVISAPALVNSATADSRFGTYDMYNYK